VSATLNIVILASLLAVSPGRIAPQPDFSPIPVAGRSCKQVSSCEEAVELWCNGYARADGDDDGIPCENVCHSLQQVEQIRKSIGC